MKRMTIISLICVCLLVVVLVGYSRIYLVDINNLYNLKYGARIVLVIKELCLIKGKDYLLCGTELIDTNKNLILIYVPPLRAPLRATALGSEVNYTDVFVLTGYITIQGDP
ncbi:MAG: hypothetical protein NT012_01265 [Candidatus Nealsonbacteria bacterium]|nr:hypothetical protein [Candidatus Nealsonbacteria bacterium]